jgi:hypothetical protein
VQGENLALLAAFPVLVLVLALAGLWLRGRPSWAIPAVVAVDLALLAAHTDPLNPLPGQLYQAAGTASVLVPPNQQHRFLSLVGAGGQLVADPRVPPGLSVADQARYRSYLRLVDARTPDVGMASAQLDADGYDGGLLPTRSYVGYRAEALPPGSSNRPDYTIPLLTSRLRSCRWLEESAIGAVVSTAGSDPNPPAANCLVPAESASGVVVWRPQGYTAARARMASGAPARVVRDTGEEVVVDLPAGASGSLILSDAYYPGWTATADGRPVVVGRYAGYLRAVPVPRGTRQVVFEYRPRWLLPGLVVSLVSALVTLALAASPEVPPALAPAARRRRPSSA